MDDFLTCLKDIINELPLDTDVVQSCKDFIANFGFIFSFFDKYCRIWESLKFKWVNDNCGRTDALKKETLDTLKKLGWMVFIVARLNIFRNKIEIADCAWMLMATMYILITNLDTDEITCSVLEQWESEIDIKNTVFDKLWKLFKATEPEPVRFSIDILSKMLEKLKETKLIQIKRNASKKLNMDEEMEAEDIEVSGIKQEAGTTEANLEEIRGMFDYINIKANLESLYNEYEHNMNPDQLDERFLLEEGVNANPINVTPFARQGNANKLKDPKQIKKEAELTQIGNTQFNSKRLLDYNASSSADEKMLTLSSQLKDIKFPNMIPSSPYSIRAFTPATPVSLALEMVNWLKLKAENAKKSLDSDGFPPVMSRHLSYWKPDTKVRILQNLDNWVDKVSYELKSDYSSSLSRGDSITNLRYLYLKLVDELLAQEENNSLVKRKKSDKEKITKELSKTLYRIEFHKAVFTWAAETILFIYNEQKLVFTQLLDFMNLSVFDFWKLVNSFIVVDPQMPTPLKRHFRDIEIKIVTELGWKFGSPILQIIETILDKAMKERKEVTEDEKRSRDVHMQSTPGSTGAFKTSEHKKEATPGSGESPMTEEDVPSKYEEEKIAKNKITSVEPHDLFFRRVLHLAAYKILTLSGELQLDDTVKEQLWEVMKQWLSYETHLLFNRHLDQIVLCTVYGVCKIQSHNKDKVVKFNEIIKKYKELQHQLTGASVQVFQNMYTHVRLEDNNYGTIIEFYNKVYIPQMKTYIMSIDPRNEVPMPRSPKPRIPALAPQSPLRQSLPPSRLTYSTIYSSRTSAGTPIRYGMNTPGMRRMPMLALTPRTKTLYAFGESATRDLERANTEIRKNSYKFKNVSEQINFGQAAMPKSRTSQSLKNQLIQSMKQGGAEGAQPPMPSTKGLTSVSGKPPAGPPPMVNKNRNVSWF